MGRYPALSPPFTAMRGALGFDVGAIDGGAPGHCPRCRQGFEQAEPEAPARPAIETVVDSRRWAILLGAIAPPASSLEDVNDARDHAPIINTSGTGLILGQMRLYRRPLGVRKPKQVSHPRLQSPD